MILDRLRRALREQNWFAVVLELLIVVLGVVIGFQVSAWGERQADAKKEQTYLRQLVADLRETERIVALRDSVMERRTHRSVIQLVNSFGLPERPPRDSVTTWLLRMDYLASPRPILGTAEALVASGDFGGIRDDSLRASVLRYHDLTREYMADQAAALERTQRQIAALREGLGHFSLVEAVGDLRTGYVETYLSGRDTTSWAASPDWRDPSPLNVYSIYADPRYLDRLEALMSSLFELKNLREVFATSATMLREQVEASI